MRLFVPLTRTEFDTLKDLARTERRRPQDQAAVMLAQVLADEPDESQISSNTTVDPVRPYAPDSGLPRDNADVPA
jgi:hypothetical protein